MNKSLEKPSLIRRELKIYLLIHLLIFAVMGALMWYSIVLINKEDDEPQVVKIPLPGKPNLDIDLILKRPYADNT